MRLGIGEENTATVKATEVVVEAFNSLRIEIKHYPPSLVLRGPQIALP